MSGEVIRRRQTVTIRTFAYIDNGRGGKSVDFNAFTDTPVDIEIEIDVAGLFKQVGEKAARSISGQSREAGGLIVARRMRKS